VETKEPKRVVKKIALVMLLSLGCATAPVGTHSPAPAAATPVDREAMVARVRAEFLHAWQGYTRYAWGHDELKPLSKAPHDWYGDSLLITPVDSLDSLILLGFTEEAEKTRAYIDEHLSFDKDVLVKNFEITIRVLGGLISAYQLTGDAKLLALADDLGARLLPAFNSPTGMPYVYVNLKTGQVKDAKSNPAEIGTLLLEFGMLAKLTKKDVYYEKAKKALLALYARRSKLGLVGEVIDVETGAWVEKNSHIGGRIDSYYEYLLKAWLLFGDEDAHRMWRESRAALDRYVADDGPGGLWYGSVDMDSGQRTGTEFGALEAFMPAVFVLDGDIERARRLEESAYAMWKANGIEPDAYDYRAHKATAPSYPLRPEIIESAYYLRRATGDARYLEMGQTFFDAIVARCRVEAGYTTLKSVITGEQGDLMHSFFLAETMKYFYLLYAPDAALDLKSVVFNTEAHPFRRTW
jgi:ER degradation enhancer, mannosidase alpha-like 2